MSHTARMVLMLTRMHTCGIQHTSFGDDALTSLLADSPFYPSQRMQYANKKGSECFELLSNA